jgi:hypothetical protein
MFSGLQEYKFNPPESTCVLYPPCLNADGVWAFICVYLVFPLVYKVIMEIYSDVLGKLK